MPPSPGPPTTYSTIAVPESAMVFIASHAARLPALAAVCALPSTDITVPLSEGVFGDIGRLLRLIDASPLQEDESVVVWAQTVQHHHLHHALPTPRLTPQPPEHHGGSVTTTGHPSQALEQILTAIQTDIQTIKTSVASGGEDQKAMKSDLAEIKRDVAGMKTDINALKVGVAALNAQSTTAVIPRSLEEQRAWNLVRAATKKELVPLTVPHIEGVVDRVPPPKRLITLADIDKAKRVSIDAELNYLGIDAPGGVTLEQARLRLKQAVGFVTVTITENTRTTMA
ncbi:uncharacterized protein EHS24_005242 [Apiotrichum porosum]|uniref:Uncharacterized protein n=1 Tax=Apiotrichum porosum TaxID=105984 RepID=A0A427XD49_9TREE|nr:uncharacterized protein EHS24_005242 [Apiotrichum porosum]RSH76841.1 hypothetical protein EHS24_005242 [Apiotrichum porosum]